MGCLFAPKRIFLCHSRGVLRFAGSAVKCFKPSLGRRAQIGFGFLAAWCNPRRVLGNVLGASDRTKPTGVCRDEVVPQISPRASLSQIRAGMETIPCFQVSSFDANVASKGTLTNPAPRRQRRGGKRVSGIKTLGLAFISFAFLNGFLAAPELHEKSRGAVPDAALAPFPAGRALLGINAELQLCPSPWRPNPKLVGILPIIVLK